jgi:hypothetical protein
MKLAVKRNEIPDCLSFFNTRGQHFTQGLMKVIQGFETFL